VCVFCFNNFKILNEMKNKIFIAFCASVIAIASLNSISKTSNNDINLNQIGVGVIVWGVNSESSISTNTGMGITSVGAAGVSTGVGGLAGIAVVSNPIGWIIGGCAVIL
jgi:hypothetical protein